MPRIVIPDISTDDALYVRELFDRKSRCRNGMQAPGVRPATKVKWKAEFDTLERIVSALTIDFGPPETA